MRKLLILSAIFIANITLAQDSKNVFLERDFWEEKPTVAVVQQKIKEGNNPSELTKHGFDAVTYAIIGKAPNETIKFLLTQKGNEIDKLTHDKRTYVFWAGYAGNLDLVKFLIKKGANLNLKDSHSMSPLTFTAAAGQTNPELYDVFEANGLHIKTDVNGSGANALLLVARSLKKISDTDYFVKKGLSLTDTDKYGNGIFNYVARSGNKEFLSEIIKKGIPYKNLNTKGENAMFFATRGARGKYQPLEYFKYLENLGIKINTVSNEGKTPLHNLSYNKDIETLKYFISKGIDVNQATKEGNTALLYAASFNTLEVIKLFAEKTKNINHTNKKGQSALIRALRNSPEIISYLIDKGAKLTVTDKNGNNLAYYLVNSFRNNKKEDFEAKVKLLSKEGFSMTTPQKNGNNLYHLAVDRNNIELLKEVSKFKANINAKNKEGLTPLHKAAMTAKDLKIINFLLEKGASKSQKTDFDETPYDLAKENEALKNTDISFLK